MPAIVSHRLPGQAGRAVRERDQPHDHDIRGKRYRKQLVYARETGPTNIRFLQSETSTQSVHHEKRGHRVPVPDDRFDHQRSHFCRGTRLLL